MELKKKQYYKSFVGYNKNSLLGGSESVFSKYASMPEDYK